MSESSNTHYKNLPIGIKPNGTAYTVFIIDDSMMAREIMKRMLLSMQFKVIDEADNGEMALNKISALKITPDLVFIDMEMPHMDGIATIKKIKPMLPNARIIMVTSHSEKEMVTELLNLGVQGYIKKPYDRDIVFKRMASILGRQIQD